MLVNSVYRYNHLDRNGGYHDGEATWEGVARGPEEEAGTLGPREHSPASLTGKERLNHVAHQRGTTTNRHSIHYTVRPQEVGEMVSLDTQVERTL